MKNIEYLFCCINRFGSSDDSIYNFTNDLSLDEEEVMRKLSSRWVPFFKLSSFDENEGLMFNETNKTDLSVIGNAYFYSEEFKKHVYAYSKIRENTIDIPPNEFRGTKYASHVLITEQANKYAVDMVDSDILKSNMLIEMDGTKERYFGDEELRDKRFREITNFEVEKEFDIEKFINNKGKIVCLLSNIVYAKNNNLKCYINFNKKSKYNEAIELFTCALKLLPVKYANKIGFSINNANLMTNNEYFTAMLFYSENTDVKSFVNDEKCHVNLFDGFDAKCIKNNGIEDTLLSLNSETLIDYLDLIEDSKEIETFEEALKLLIVLKLYLKKYPDNSSQLEQTVTEVNSSLSLIKENFDFISKLPEIKSDCYNNIKDALRLAFTNPNISNIVLEKLFNLILELNDPTLFDIIIDLSKRENEHFKFFRKLVCIKNESFLSFIENDGWNDFYDAAIKASKNEKIFEAIDLFLKLYKHFAAQGRNNILPQIVNFIVDNDDNGLKKIIDFDLVQTDQSLINKISRIISYISKFDDSNKEELSKKAFLIIKDKRQKEDTSKKLVSFTSFINCLTELNDSSTYDANFIEIVNLYIERLISEEFVSENNFEKIKNILNHYNLLLASDKEALNNYSIQAIEYHLAENVIANINAEDINITPIEYLSTKEGLAVFKLIQKLCENHKDVNKYNNILCALKIRLNDFEEYQKKVKNEKKYTKIRVESMLHSLKALSDSTIVKILDEFAFSYKNRERSFTLDLKEREIQPTSADPKFYERVNEITEALLGASETDDEYLLKAELSSKKKKEFAIRVDEEYAKIQNIDYKTAIGDYTASLILGALLTAVFASLSILVSYTLMKYCTNGSFRVLFIVLSVLCSVSPGFFYILNYKERRLHNAFIRTLWESLVVFILVFGIASLIFCIK